MINNKVQMNFTKNFQFLLSPIFHFYSSIFFSVIMSDRANNMATQSDLLSKSLIDFIHHVGSLFYTKTLFCNLPLYKPNQLVSSIRSGYRFEFQINFGLIFYFNFKNRENTEILLKLLGSLISFSRFTVTEEDCSVLQFSLNSTICRPEIVA